MTHQIANLPFADARSRKVKQAYLKQNDGTQSPGMETRPLWQIWRVGEQREIISWVHVMLRRCQWTGKGEVPCWTVWSWYQYELLGLTDSLIVDNWIPIKLRLSVIVDCRQGLALGLYRRLNTCGRFFLLERRQRKMSIPASCASKQSMNSRGQAAFAGRCLGRS